MSTDDFNQSFDPYAQPPEFTPEEEQAARDEGFFDAYDRWKWVVGGKLSDNGRERIKARTKAQGLVDLGSIGLTSADLGALSDESLHLPRDPDYRAEAGDPRAQKHPYFRHAQFVGACNRLMKVYERLDRYELALDMDSSELWGDQLSVYHWAHAERGKVARTLDVLGEDIEDVEARIESGEIQYQEFIEAPHVVSADPEVRRIQEACREDMRQAGVDLESDEELTIDLREDNPAQSKIPRLIAQEVDGPARYDDASTEELQTRTPRIPPERASGGTVKDHAYGLMKERLSQLTDLLSDLGYSRNADIGDVAPADWEAFRQIQQERQRIAGDLADLTEELADVERELDEDRFVYGDADPDPGGDAHGADRTFQASPESIEMETDAGSGETVEFDEFEQPLYDMDGLEEW